MRLNRYPESVPPFSPSPSVQAGRPNWCHPPDEPNWGHPADESAKRSHGRIGATRQSIRQSTSRPNWCHPPFQPAIPKLEPPVGKLVPPGSLNRCHPSFQSVESEPTVASANWCHSSVEVASPNRCHPSVEYGRTRRIGATRQFTWGEGGRTGATRQLNSGGEREWCHPLVRRRRGVPALGLVLVAGRLRWALIRLRCSLIRQRNTLLGLVS